MAEFVKDPAGFLITFSCYGARIHGSKRGSVDDAHCTYGTPYAPPNQSRWVANRRRLTNPPFRFDQDSAVIARNAIIEAAFFKNWELYALHVRSNHIHTVLSAGDAPENILAVLKRQISRRLNQLCDPRPRRKRWARGGSTRYLWKETDVEAAIEYVLYRQGSPFVRWPDD